MELQVPDPETVERTRQAAERTKQAVQQSRPAENDSVTHWAMRPFEWVGDLVDSFVDYEFWSSILGAGRGLSAPSEATSAAVGEGIVGPVLTGLGHLVVRSGSAFVEFAVGLGEGAGGLVVGLAEGAGGALGAVFEGIGSIFEGIGDIF